MLCRTTTFHLDGLDPRRVTVEADLRAGLPSFTIVGLGDRAVRESRERIHAAIVNSGLAFPEKRVTVNLAPAALHKQGPGFDLAIACALLVATGQAKPDLLEVLGFFGELSLGGEVRPVRGALAVAEGARDAGLRGLVVGARSAREAALVEGLGVHAVTSLVDVVAVLAGKEPDGADRLPVEAPQERPSSSWRPPDLADVRGHGAVIESLAVAAAGGHNVLLSGPPGTGKTMLARRIPSILPPMGRREAVEVTRIHSVAGRSAEALVRERPFRAPHHGISAPALVGGGPVPRPGEITLAQASIP